IDQNPAIQVTATADGRFFINLDAVLPGELEARLAHKIRDARKKAVVFRGDQSVDLKTLMKVMAAARRAGATSFDIAHTAPPDPGDE
ncbi:MAG: biopolymer transporter ExbD, partial [Phycisphaerae bacterium]|nr:biopolymer transporter ExbD [Phycisphaerae bacterium]